MSITVTTNAPFPPTKTVLGTSVSGTITLIKSYGPCNCIIYSAAGVQLRHIDNTKRPPGMAHDPCSPPTLEDFLNSDNWGNPIVRSEVSIEFSDGPPYAVQTTGGSIEFTIE